MTTMELTSRLELKQEQRLTLSQQQLLLNQLLLTLRLELVGVLRGESYEPKGDCPNCERKLTPSEILRGFTQDPNDFTTFCSGCGTRFEPILVCSGNERVIEIPFYCDSQTLHHLIGKETLSPEQLSHDHPGLYRSAIVHHGGIRNAFKKIGIDYPFEEISDWRNKIKAFLGRLPDVIIADCVEVSASTISYMRRKLGIPRFTRNTALAEVL